MTIGTNFWDSIIIQDIPTKIHKDAPTMPVMIGIPLDPEDTKIEHRLQSTHTAWRGIEAPPPHRRDESCYWHNVTGEGR